MNFQRRKNLKKNDNKYIIFAIIFLIISVFYFFNSYKNFKNLKIKESKEITIEKWESFSSLSKKIPDFNNFYYRIYLRFEKPNFELKEWKYKIVQWEDISKTFERLQKTIQNSENLTILEWWNIYDIDRTLSYKWLISGWDFVKYVTNKEKVKKFSQYYDFLKSDKIESLEWFLYPDTYKIDTQNFKINVLVTLQLDEFEKKVYNKLFAWKYNNETIYDVVNLASIVEKEESRIKKEQPIVAGILKKRLNAWWMIWADATVCYPYKLPTSECTQKVVNKYVYEKNDYNTRTMKWLPKTPIANPSFDTINSTLNDEKTDYWYYLHNLKTWKIYYAKTNEEHNYNRANFMNQK